MLHVPINSLQAEQSVLWALLIDHECFEYVIWFLEPDMFYSDSNKVIYKAMLDLRRNNIPVDLITLKEKLETMEVYDENWKPKLNKEKMLHKVWWISYLTDLTEVVPTTAHTPEYANIIYEKYNLRKLHEAFERWIDNIYIKNMNSTDVLKLLEYSIRSITTWKTSWEVKKIKDIILDRMETLYNFSEHFSERQVYTWFKQLDKLLWPLMWWQLVVIWARPWQGKTAMSLAIADNLVKQNKKVVIFSMEMNEKQIVDRFISMNTWINSHQLSNWTNRPEETSKEEFEKDRWQKILKIQENIDYLLDSDLYLDCSTKLTINKIRSRLSLLNLQWWWKPLDLVIIDYLWLMTPENKWMNKVNEIAEITRALKVIAWEFDVPIILLSQLSRNVDWRNDKIPVLSDLRDSGSIEQDANKVLMLYRDRYYNPTSYDESLTVLIAKNREWKSWNKVHLFYDLPSQKIRDITKEEFMQYNLDF